MEDLTSSSSHTMISHMYVLDSWHAEFYKIFKRWKHSLKHLKNDHFATLHCSQDSLSLFPMKKRTKPHSRGDLGTIEGLMEGWFFFPPPKSGSWNLTFRDGVCVNCLQKLLEASLEEKKKPREILYEVPINLHNLSYWFAFAFYQFELLISE